MIRVLYGNCLTTTGSIQIGNTHVKTDPARDILQPHRETLGFVRQFLRVASGVPTFDVVAKPLFRTGIDADPTAIRTRVCNQDIDVAQFTPIIAP